MGIAGAIGHVACVAGGDQFGMGVPQQSEDVYQCRRVGNVRVANFSVPMRTVAVSGAGWPQALPLTKAATIAIIIRCILLTTDRKSTRLNSSHSQISYAVFCLKKKRRRRRRALSVLHRVGRAGAAGRP